MVCIKMEFSCPCQKQDKSPVFASENALRIAAGRSGIRTDVLPAIQDNLRQFLKERHWVLAARIFVSQNDDIAVVAAIRPCWGRFALSLSPPEPKTQRILPFLSLQEEGDLF